MTKLAMLAAIVSIATFSATSSALSAQCTRTTTIAAMTHMQKVDSTGVFHELGSPYSFNSNLVRFDIEDFSGFGDQEYYVDVTIDNSCNVTNVSANPVSN